VFGVSFNEFVQLDKDSIQSQVLVAHTYNPSYSGGRGQDRGSKPAQANSSQNPISKKKKIHHKKRAGGVA
jgi:hypothetical protein